MRILFIINSLIYGGAETQVIRLGKELASRGHTLVIYTLNLDNPRISELENCNIQIIQDNKSSKLDLGLVLRMRRFGVGFRADIVQGFLYDGDLYARIAFFGTGIPVLNSERNDNYHFTFQQLLGIYLTRTFANGLVANTHAGAAFAGKYFRLPAENIHVVWNGIDLESIDKRCQGDVAHLRQTFFSDLNIKIACLVGMIRPEKDYCLAIKVAKALTEQYRDWKVLLVGDCLPQTQAYKNDVLKLFESMDLEGRVSFAGLRRDSIEIIKACDVLFSTSMHEGFPNVVLESMVVGTPVVSTDYSDIKKILPESWQVIRTRQPDDIAQAIIRAYSERDLISRKQRKWVEENASISRSADVLLNVYNQYQ